MYNIYCIASCFQNTCKAMQVQEKVHYLYQKGHRRRAGEMGISHNERDP